jgi:hypothetical protein
MNNIFMIGGHNALKCLPEDEQRVVERNIAEILLRIYKQDGPREFENPKGAAVAHEVGHAIVSMHDGVRIESISIWKHSGGVVPDSWIGETTRKIGWRIDDNTPPVDALKTACYLIAGEVGEWVLKRDEYRKTTSMDEVAMVQRIALGFARRFEMRPEDLFQQVRTRAAEIIRHNRAVADNLMARLDRKQTLRRRDLGLLDRVQKIPNDWNL